MKKFISGLAVGLILSLSLTAFAAVKLNVVPNPYPVLIDGKKADVNGYSINGSTFLKLTDLKAAGINAEFNKKEKRIDITTSENKTNTENTTTNYFNPTSLYDGDNFTITTYKEYQALIYNNNTYILSTEFTKKTHIRVEFNGKSNTYKLYKNEELILDTKDANPINYIRYKGFTYFNINFLGKYLEE
jgi:hypothetical protein